MHFNLTSEQARFEQVARDFARNAVAPLAQAIDERDEFPAALAREAGGLGLMGVTVPRQWGGAGLDTVSYVLALEQVARASATMAVILVVNNSLVVEPLARFGSDDQKARWLAPLARGEQVGAFALSEEEAGTDAANQQTVAVRADRGFRLNGRKTWVTCASHASVIIVFATLADERRPDGAVSAFLVPADSPGLSRGARSESMGVRGLGGMDIELRDVHVAPDQMLGAAGEGFELARWAFEGARIAIAAQAVGIGEVAFDESRRHAKQRKTFGKPIASYEAIQFMLADSATEIDAARVLTLRAAAARDARDRCGVEAAMAKLYASEAAARATDRAMQILASAGYRRGSLVERLYRDVRASEMYPGTSEVQRMIVSGAVLRK
ncbi:MAG: acyl-CoA dehydrogenase family protein [Bacteroidales bacterium]